jgi:hypothetical protein
MAPRRAARNVDATHLHPESYPISKGMKAPIVNKKTHPRELNPLVGTVEWAVLDLNQRPPRCQHMQSHSEM